MLSRQLAWGWSPAASSESHFRTCLTVRLNFSFFSGPLTLKHTNQHTWVTTPLVGIQISQVRYENGDAIPNVISLGAPLL